MANLKCWGKRLLKYGLIGLVIIIGIKMISGRIPKANAVKASASAVSAPIAYDFSKMTESYRKEEIYVPAGQTVSIAHPCNYRVVYSWDGEYEFDPGLGRKKKIRVGANEDINLDEKWGGMPLAIEIRSLSAGGKMEIRFYRHKKGKREVAFR